MGTRRIFSGVGNEGSEGQKSPSRVQGQLPGGAVGPNPQEDDDIFSKWCINTLFTEVLDNICTKKPLFNISRGQVLPHPVHACGRPWCCPKATVTSIRIFKVAIGWKRSSSPVQKNIAHHQHAVCVLCYRLQEKHVLEMQCKHQRSILELQEKLKLNLQQVCKWHCTIAGTSFSLRLWSCWLSEY